MWREIGQDPNSQLDRLTLGPNGQHWGVRRDVGSCTSFADVDDCGSFMRRFYPKMDLVDSYDEVDFVALGVDGDWAFAVNGRVEYRGSNLLRNRITEGRRSGKTIMVCSFFPSLFPTILMSNYTRAWQCRLSVELGLYRLTTEPLITIFHKIWQNMSTNIVNQAIL